MSHPPRALLAYANDCPSGDRLGLVSNPDASVSCVNPDHSTAPGAADRWPSHQESAAVVTNAPSAKAGITARRRADAGRRVAASTSSAAEPTDTSGRAS